MLICPPSSSVLLLLLAPDPGLLLSLHLLNNSCHGTRVKGHTCHVSRVSPDMLRRGLLTSSSSVPSLLLCLLNSALPCISSRSHTGRWCSDSAGAADPDTWPGELVVVLEKVPSEGS